MSDNDDMGNQRLTANTSSNSPTPNRRDAIRMAIAAASAAGSAAQSATFSSAMPPPFFSSDVAQAATSATIKSQAASDYSRSLSAFNGRLSQPSEELIASSSAGQPYDFDIAVIGSGYGASITAARLAAKLRPGLKLCILERGKEWIPGTFPDKFQDCGMSVHVGLEMQVTVPRRVFISVRNPSATTMSVVLPVV